MAHFILLLRNEAVDFSKYSAEQYQSLVAAFDSWNSGLNREGKLICSANLKNGEGKTLRLNGTKTAIDGPYCETKEAVAGFFLLQAADYDEAVELAKGCPFLPIGGSVEVRAAHFELEAAYREPTHNASQQPGRCE